MQQPDPTEIFDQEHAESYDQRFLRMAPLRDSIHILSSAILKDLPANARILCVGAGTGAELIYLAEKNPGWHFTAVEPSAPMLDVCRRRTQKLGLQERCTYHHGYVESLPEQPPFDAALSILVSHFILADEARAAFFRAIAQRLQKGGLLITADLAGDSANSGYESLFKVWLTLIQSNDLTNEEIAIIRNAYDQGVAIWPPEQIRKLIADCGFSSPVAFFQGGLIHGCYAKVKS